MTDLNSIIVFDDKSLADVLKEVYQNTVVKRETLDDVVEQLRSYMTSPGDAMVLAPMIKDLLEVSTRNEENLLKIASVVVRIHNGAKNVNIQSNTFLISDEEREYLQRLAKESAAKLREISEREVIQLESGEEKINKLNNRLVSINDALNEIIKE